MPVEVAGEPPVDDDDWEWTIALAKARAEDAVQPPPAAPTRPRSSRTRPMPAVAAPAVPRDPAASGEWPTTAPIGAIDYDGSSRRSARRLPRPHEAPSTPPARDTPDRRSRIAGSGDPDALPGGAGVFPRGIERPPSVTVIPVPTLPSVHSTNGANRLQPVLRTQASAPANGALRRFADGTLAPETGPHVAQPDDTDPNISVGDRTTPGFAMPRAAHSGAPRGRPARR
jgi:hypothetical protein